MVAYAVCEGADGVIARGEVVRRSGEVVRKSGEVVRKGFSVWSGDQEIRTTHRISKFLC